MRLFRHKYSFLAGAAGLLLLTPLSEAKDKKTAPKPPQDEIEVLGHIPLTDGPIRRFIATQHYSSFYLYAEQGGAGKITLIDITKASTPAILANVVYPGRADSSNLSVVAGTAALVVDGGGTDDKTPQPQTVRIFDFSDPQHPKIAREFSGVTAMSRDDRRGLIFLANSEGIWILHQKLAEDPEIEKAYEHEIMYNH